MSEHFPSAPRVNGGRLWSRLMQMAEIGATASGGCNRQALTDGDMAGRQFSDAMGRSGRLPRAHR